MSEGQTSRHHLEASSTRSFAGDARWPIESAALAALMDLGLSQLQIAKYFSVATDDVLILAFAITSRLNRGSGRQLRCDRAA